MKCKCGCEEFCATQSVRGKVAIIVDGNETFLRNPSDVFDSSGLYFSDPEGPFICNDCNAKWKEDVKEDVQGILNRHAMEQGWTLATERQVLMEYIEGTMADSDDVVLTGGINNLTLFEEYLKTRIELESL